jgi:ADP-ribosyl-[dinitrogen reductase] hydrolase
VIRHDTADSPYDDDVAMALRLAEELLEPEPDLEHLGRRWIEWARTDGRGIGNWTRTALDYLARNGRAITNSLGQAGNGAVMRCLPVALASFTDPEVVVRRAWDTAVLTHPDPRAAWPAVAVSVAAAGYLRGDRDVIPEVLGVLGAGGARDEVLGAVRRVPAERRKDLPITGAAAGYAVHCMEIALWAAHHEPSLEQALIWLVNAGGDTDTNAAVAGGLLGARDGEEAVPERWIGALPGPDYLRMLADRLIGRRR